MPIKVSIRQAKPSDSETIFSALTAAIDESNNKIFPEERRNYTIWNNNFQLSFVYKNLIVIVALDGDDIIGFTSCYILPRLELGNTYMVCEDVHVTKPYRNQGIGTLLFNRIKEIATQNNCKYISLTTLNENQIAKEFYKKQGFIQDEIAFSYDTSITNANNSSKDQND